MSDSINPLEKRMESIMTVIDTAILSLDNQTDQLMIACAMMQRTREIFDQILGEEGRKKMFQEVSI